MKTVWLLTLSVLGLNYAMAAPVNQHSELLTQLHLPAGFSISVFAENLPNARSMALGDDGIIYVGTRQEGKIYAVQDSNGDGKADKTYTLASDLYMPNGVAYKDGSLYVAQPHRIIRFDQIGKHLEHPPAPVVIFAQLPADKHHGWKYLRFGADNKLYSAVGAPCNICKSEKSIYASLFRLNPDGSDFEIIASGVRNTVGFDWQPQTNALFFTENGRDELGDDVPADELNQWSKVGEHFGYPYCHGGEILDPQFGGNKKCSDFVAPVWKFKAHNAPLGMRFYQGKQFPQSYQNQLFVAQHGSWNRSVPDGYRVALIQFKDNKPVSEQVFIDGWLTENNQVLGRPVDILELANGSLLISDDKLGLIYQVQFKP
jgi:glucose/arabinose dehydrogenase